MIKNIYSVRDNLAEVFNDPFPHINNATAIRDFQAGMAENPNKEDFSLYHVGTIDLDSGDVKGVDPIKIYSGLDMNNEK
jgi:hypothetical protein